MHRGAVHDADYYEHEPGFAIWENILRNDCQPFSGTKRRVFVRWIHTRILHRPTGETLMVGREMFVPSDPNAVAPIEKPASERPPICLL